MGLTFVIIGHPRRPTSSFLPRRLLDRKCSSSDRFSLILLPRLGSPSSILDSLLLRSFTLESGHAEAFFELVFAEEEGDDFVRFRSSSFCGSSGGGSDDGVLDDLLVTVRCHGSVQVLGGEERDVPSELDDTLVDSVFRNETINSDLLRLSKTMRTIHSLKIILYPPQVSRGSRRESLGRTEGFQSES